MGHERRRLSRNFCHKSSRELVGRAPIEGAIQSESVSPVRDDKGTTSCLHARENGIRERDFGFKHFPGRRNLCEIGIKDKNPHNEEDITLIVILLKQKDKHECRRSRGSISPTRAVSSSKVGSRRSVYGRKKYFCPRKRERGSGKVWEFTRLRGPSPRMGTNCGAALEAQTLSPMGMSD